MSKNTRGTKMLYPLWSLATDIRNISFDINIPLISRLLRSHAIGQWLYQKIVKSSNPGNTSLTQVIARTGIFTRGHGNA